METDGYTYYGTSLSFANRASIFGVYLLCGTFSSMVDTKSV